MGYRRHDAPSPLLIGYDPATDLPKDHLARLVEMVVNEAVPVPEKPIGRGQPAFDPRLCIKVLIYGYATGVRSSRQLEKNCNESLPYLFLSRGDTPSYHTLCSARTSYSELLEAAWTSVFAVASASGMRRLGRIVVDSTKLQANASSEMTLDRDEYAKVRSALKDALAEAAIVDAREDKDGYAGETRTGKDVDKCQMRDIVRRVRKSLTCQNVNKESIDERSSSCPKAMTKKMVERVKGAVAAIDQAQSDGRKHLCLTDPDARMMQGGREKRVHQCHSLEVAIDRDCGVLVANDVTAEASDNDRLEPLVEAARRNEPCGVTAADGDSGYFKTEALLRLSSAGIDLCVPDSTTACELHRGLPVGSLRRRCAIEFDYDSEQDLYRCPQGNLLTHHCSRGEVGMLKKEYRASRSCKGCPSYCDCIVRLDGKPAKSQRKCIITRERSKEADALMSRFSELEHRNRYNKRASIVETVFGFLRATLGYNRWLLRGEDKVKSEGKLIALGYQLRKVALAWTGS